MANLKKASDQLFMRSTDERFESLDDLLQHCRGQQERSQDLWHSPQLLAVTPRDDGMCLEAGTDGAFLLNDWSFSQLCSMSRVQKATVNRLSPNTAGQVLRETMPQGKRPVQLMTSGTNLRSVHGVAYSRLWNADLLSVLSEYDDFQPPPKGFNGATGLYAGEQDMFAFLIDPDGWIEVGGEHFAPGFFCWNSEVGKRSVGIQTFWYQRICANHIVWDAIDVVDFARKHTGRIEESLTDIRGLIDALIARRDERKDSFAAAVKMAMNTKLGNDTEEVIQAVVRHGISQALVKRVLEAQKVPPRTLWGVVDALTRHTREQTNAGDRTDADQKIANLLTLAV